MDRSDKFTTWFNLHWKGGFASGIIHMKNFVTKYLKFCPQTGKFIGVGRLNGFSRLLFPVIGIAAMVWILLRVIPKPSRLSYPCVRTAMPIASGFIGYLVMLAISGIALFRSKQSLRYYPVFFLGAFVVFGISGSYYAEPDNFQKFPTISVASNQPMGVGKGIFPGRVVWIHDTSAVNQKCVVNQAGHAWYLRENNNQATVDKMISSGLHSITGQTSDSAAWRMVFQFHNTKRGKGPVNYKPGEKIFIKTNATSAWSGNFNTSNMTPNQYISETSVAPVLTVLRQLVNVVGVAQTDIYVGDPMKHIYKHLYDAWHGEFPNVHYLDYNLTTLGREKVVASTTAKITYSDKGSVLLTNSMSPGSTNRVPVIQDYLYTIFETAEYMINIPQLKGHQRGGITMFAKNHFGSHTRGDAGHLHMGLVRPFGTAIDPTMRSDYGMYRIQVDLITHKFLGAKNLIYIMDALWATSYELDIPRKWQMAPFNNTFMSSMFVSLDPVAIESVGYDFLRTEFTDVSGFDASAQMPGVDDYLHQAADSNNWPVGIKYDPDNSGQHVYSLGTHEHWDNATDMKYSRNLNPTSGTGIELVETEQTATSVADVENAPEYFRIYQNYPNPFNPSTTIAYSLPEKSSVVITIFDLQGRELKSFTVGAQSAGYQKVVWNGTNERGSSLSSGVYVYRVAASSLADGKTFVRSAKMLLLK
ncbi:MAG: DUF362 domain-containing protein [Ignavibacteriae bacterium]|nr:MAG: DUF362 domain-containing protein [Ignavibacteriota bacterium]